MRRAGNREVVCPCENVSAERVAGSRISIGARPATALADSRRLQDMPPAQGCSGDRHCPGGPGSPMRTSGDGRTQGADPFAAASADKRRQPAPLENAKGCKGTALPPDCAAHPLRMRLCRDAGRRAMSAPGAGSQAAEGPPGGRKGRTASDKREKSVSCVAFRTARSRLLRPSITRDSCRYRA